MKPYSIVLADDHALFRQGLKGIIAGKPDLRVIGEAGDGLELLNLLNTMVPDLVILDISMPHLRGIEAISEIKTMGRAVKILVLTMHNDKEYLYKTVTAGADGYLLKEDADPELFTAIDKLRHGKKYVSPRLAEDLVDDWAHIRSGDVPVSAKAEELSTRESEVLKLTAEGKSSREISELLFISHRTVERHRANLMSKLKINKAADLVRYAVSKGYV